MSRTITVHVANLSGLTLYFGNAKSAEGPAATADKASVAPGQTIAVKAYNNSTFNGGNKGTFDLNDAANQNGRTNFTIFYTHPQLKGATYVQLQTPRTSNKGPYTSGNCLGSEQVTYTGDPVNAAVNVYVGVPVGATGGYAVPLQPRPYDVGNNVQDFANSMFGPKMRAESLIPAAFDQGTIPYKPADFSGGQIGKIVEALEKSWNDGSGPDSPILNFLKNYIAPAGTAPLMQMWVPTLGYIQKTSPSAYRLGGYRPFALASRAGNAVAWNRDAVHDFLQLLVGGAHFVAVSATADFTNQGLPYATRDLYSLFRESGLPQRGDPTSSHYGSLANVTGQYYLDIKSEDAPPGCGFLLALLFGRTVNSTAGAKVGTYNTFMQLEGWPANGLGNTRHNADYEAYKKTLWNTATYGACPYSEKRATTVFLAPTPWTPQVYQTTRMMPYVGAYASGKYPNGKTQGWLDTGLVTIPADAPALPQKYYD